MTPLQLPRMSGCWAELQWTLAVTLQHLQRLLQGSVPEPAKSSQGGQTLSLSDFTWTRSDLLNRDSTSHSGQSILLSRHRHWTLSSISLQADYSFTQTYR